jgi:hypothetical protein
MNRPNHWDNEGPHYKLLTDREVQEFRDREAKGAISDTDDDSSTDEEEKDGPPKKGRESGRRQYKPCTVSQVWKKWYPREWWKEQEWRNEAFDWCYNCTWGTWMFHRYVYDLEWKPNFDEDLHPDVEYPNTKHARNNEQTQEEKEAERKQWIAKNTHTSTKRYKTNQGG